MVVHYPYYLWLDAPFTVDGQWGPFGSWSSCSQTCGGGIRTRQRACDNPPPSNGGENCKGKKIEQRKCNRQACPG